MFDATINHLIEVSAVDGYTVIAPGRYRILLQLGGGADLIRLDRGDKVPIHLTALQGNSLTARNAWSGRIAGSDSSVWLL